MNTNEKDKRMKLSFDEYLGLAYGFKDSNPFRGRTAFVNRVRDSCDNPKIIEIVNRYKQLPLHEYCERVQFIIDFCLFPDSSATNRFRAGNGFDPR